jgi:hypothetical protein
MSSTAVSMRANASRVRSTTSTPSSVRRAPSSTTSTALLVSCWIAATSPEISCAACWDSSASLRTSSATTAKPTALLAGAGRLDRRVQRQQVGLLGDPGDRLHDRSDLLGLAAGLDRLQVAKQSRCVPHCPAGV